MANPLETLKKLKGRSLQEIRTRGEQALTARVEQIGLSGKLPTDEEFAEMLDRSFFAQSSAPPSSEELLKVFAANSSESFFQSFADLDKTLEIFRQNFSDRAKSTIERADRIAAGRFDLLGYKNLDFGTPVDWHYEPIAGKHIPLKHWKQYDELATDETGDKKIVWELNRHQHFFTLGTAYRLTADERYAEVFARHLDDWMKQNPPGTGINWVSSLEVALRAISWIWAFQFFKDSVNLTPELFQNALRYLILHGRHIEKYLSTYYSPNTHLTGEALGLFYLGTQLKFITRSEQWRGVGESVLLAELDRQILPDGVYFEQTTWYQRYTADFYTHFLILKERGEHESNTKSVLKLRASLQKQLDFLMQITRPDGTTPIIGDDDGGRSLPLSSAGAPDDFGYLLATGAVLFGRGDYKYVAREFSEETLWLLGAKGSKDFAQLAEKMPEQTSRGFSSGGYFVMRDGWAETDNYLLIDGGNMGALAGGHSHADTLSIDLATGGKTMLVDPGTYTYHESEELRNRFRTTGAHNTLVVGDESSSEPGGKFNWKSRAQTRVKNWISEPRFDYFEGLHDGYERLQDAPATHIRAVLFLKNDYWILRDFVKTGGENFYRQNFQFDNRANPQIIKSETGASCVGESSDRDAGLRIFTFGDNGNWRKRESFVSKIYGERETAAAVSFDSQGTGGQEFFTFLLPTDSYAEQPEVYETEIANGRAFVINFRGYQDLFVFTDGDQPARTEFFDTNFRFFWARLAEGAELPEEYVAIGGTTFFLNGKEIVYRSTPLEFLTARLLGNRLNVRTSESVFSLTLPQTRSHQRILTELE